MNNRSKRSNLAFRARSLLSRASRTTRRGAAVQLEGLDVTRFVLYSPEGSMEGIAAVAAVAASATADAASAVLEEADHGP